MPAIVVRDLPPAIHQKLKQQAERNHRSMNREIIAVLEREMNQQQMPSLPPPVKGKVRGDGRWIAQVIREARDGRP